MNMLLLSVVILTSAGALDSTAVQGIVDAAKAQYAAASYEEALTTLARAETNVSEKRIEIEQYRALCLIALGRLPEAERAVARLVHAEPTYVLSRDVASPRVLSLFAEMRRKELPAVARRLLEAGRDAFEENDLRRATTAFQHLLEVLDQADAASMPERDDMRVLAEGFVALSEHLTRPRPEPDLQARSDSAPAEPKAGPSAAPVVLPAIAIHQDIPTWNPPDVATGARAFKGAIRVRIGADGRVRSATIEETTHPAFDTRLLQAAEDWTYHPATRDGAPVESEKLLVIQLNPRE